MSDGVKCYGERKGKKWVLSDGFAFYRHDQRSLSVKVTFEQRSKRNGVT